MRVDLLGALKTALALAEHDDACAWGVPLESPTDTVRLVPCTCGLEAAEKALYAAMEGEMNHGGGGQDGLADIRSAARARLSEDHTDGFAAVVLGLVANAERQRHARWRAHFEQITALRLALRDLLDVHAGPCRFDHEGYCQEHSVSQPCVVAAARAVLGEG